MIALLAIALLVIAAAAILSTRIWRPGFGYSWLAAALGSLAAWGLALAAWSQAPRSFTALAWQPSTLMPASPVLILDAVSWPYLLAVVSLNLAVVLADVHRIMPGGRGRATRGDLAAGLCLAAVAALATMAGNLLTLLLLWSAVDLTLVLIGIRRASSDRDIETTVISLTVRLASHVVIIWGGLAASAAGASTSLAPVAGEVLPYLITAAGLRLGLLPPHRPISQGETLSPGLNTLVWLVPAAAALTQLERAAASGPPVGAGWFMLIGAGAILYAGWSWMKARSAQSGLPYYLLGYSALALAGAARGLPFAGPAWGISGLLAGGLLALMGPRTRAPIVPLLIGGVFTAGLPFTPTWIGVDLFTWPFPMPTILFLIGQGLLLAGFVRLAIRRSAAPPTAERWVWLIYPLGLAILPVSQAFITIFLRPGTPGGPLQWPGALASGLSLVAVGVAVFAAALMQRRGLAARRISLPPRSEPLLPVLELSWVYQAIWSLYRWVSRLAARLAWALEGRAGLLWALLVLTLLLSLLAQIGLGG